MNQIILTGRLTKDVKIGTSQNNTTYSIFSLAVDRPFQKGETDFMNCVAFGKIAEILNSYCSKGSKIGVVGTLQQTSYEKDGQKTTSYKVVVSSIELIETKKSVSHDNNDNDSDEEFPF